MARASLKRPLAFTLLSFAVLALIVVLSSPIKNVTFAIFFFAALFCFLVSFGHLAVQMISGYVTPATRSRIVIISAFIVMALMFKSAQSLNWVDALILVLVIGGLIFYTGRRAK